MNTLFLINGKSGAGKTTVAKQLLDNFENAALLDMDDLVRVKPWEYNEELISLGASNASLLIKNFFKLGYTNVILSGGIHEQKLVDALVPKSKEINVIYVWLFADQDVREKRRLARSRDDADQKENFDLVDSLIPEVESITIKDGDFMKINTSSLSVDQVVERIISTSR